MAIVSLTAIHPNPGTSCKEIQKNVKAGNDLVKKHGGENVTTMVTIYPREHRDCDHALDRFGLGEVR